MLKKVLEKIKNKENISIFIIILLISIIICFDFIKFHTVPDTYNVLAQQYEYSTTFWLNGRIISALYLILGKVINIPITSLEIISNIFSIIFQSISVYIIYKAITKKEDKLISKIIYLIGAYLIVYNPFAIEHLAFLECGVMCLGKLTCTIAAKMLVKDGKIALPIVLTIIASMCYQGIINVFITIGLLLLLLENNNQTVKQKLTKVLKIGIICVISLATMVIILKLGNYIFGETQNRIAKNNRGIIESLFIIEKLSIKLLFFSGWNLFQNNLIAIVISITALLFVIYKKQNNALLYFMIIVLILLSCAIPLILQNVISIAARTTSSIGAILRNINYYVRRYSKTK